MLPPDLLNKCKVIFVGRSPKDCCVSYYHHYLNLSTLCKYNFKGTFPDFVQLFMTGLVGFGNYWTILKVCTIAWAGLFSFHRCNYKIFLGNCPSKYVRENCLKMYVLILALNYTVWTVNDVLNRSILLESSRSISFFIASIHPFKRVWIKSLSFIG